MTSVTIDTIIAVVEGAHAQNSKIKDHDVTIAKKIITRAYNTYPNYKTSSHLVNAIRKHYILSTICKL